MWPKNVTGTWLRQKNPHAKRSPPATLQVPPLWSNWTENNIPFDQRKCDVSDLTRLYWITACDIKLWSWEKWGKWTSCQDPIILDDDHLLRRNLANIPNAPTGFHSQLNAAIEGCERRVQHSGWAVTPRHLWICYYICVVQPNNVLIARWSHLIWHRHNNHCSVFIHPRGFSETLQLLKLSRPKMTEISTAGRINEPVFQVTWYPWTRRSY